MSDGCAPAKSRNLQLPRDLLCVSRQVLEMEKMFSNEHCWELGTVDSLSLIKEEPAVGCSVSGIFPMGRFDSEL